MNATAEIAEREQWLAHRPFDPRQPQGFFLEKEPDERGESADVATIFLTNRECPWRCIYCDLWKSTLTETVPPGAIPAQIDVALQQLHRKACSQIKLYNAGSFFDPKAIPPNDFAAIAERVRRFQRVIVECHPALVDESAVQFRDLLRAGPMATRLEVAMGLEIADDAILAKLNKRMTLAMFARAARFLREHDIALRAFVIVKPPFVREENRALAFAKQSIDFAFGCGATVVSLIPARFGSSALEMLAARGEFSPPKLSTLEEALNYGVGLRLSRVFADLWDLEKFAECSSCFAARRERLDAMNQQQIVLPPSTCRLCNAE